jgi:hypothetical protein
MNTDTTNNGLTRTLSDITSPLIPETGTTGSENWFYFSWKTWIIIILILAFLGINVFAYLGKGINDMTTFLKPILNLIGYKAVSTTEQTADVALTGAKAGAGLALTGAKAGAGLAAKVGTTGLDVAASGIDLAAKGATTGINFVAGGTSDVIKGASNMIKGKIASSTLPTETTVTQEKPQTQNQKVSVEDDDNVQKLKSALNDASRSSTVVPDSAQSSIQSAGKGGWCFIGEEKGTRNCSKVGANDKCMSNQVFDTNEQCTTPLRI